MTEGKRGRGSGMPSERHLEAARLAWNLEGSLEFVRNVANVVYKGTRGGEPVFIRLVSAEVRTEVQLDAETRFAAHLRARGAHVAEALPSRRGKLFETLREDGATFRAVVFRSARGVPPDLKAPSADSLLLPAWGETLARFHRASEELGEAPWMAARADWDTESVKTDVDRFLAKGEEAPVSATDLREWKHALDWMGRLPKKGSTYGLVHADFHAGNFFVEGNTLDVFDFDDCCRHWFAYDFAVSLSSVLHARKSTLRGDGGRLAAGIDKACDAFREGYERVRPFGDEMQRHAMLFVRYRALLIPLWLRARFLEGGPEGQRKEETVALVDGLDQWRAELSMALPAFP